MANYNLRVVSKKLVVIQYGNEEKQMSVRGIGLFFDWNKDFPITLSNYQHYIGHFSLRDILQIEQYDLRKMSDQAKSEYLSEKYLIEWGSDYQHLSFFKSDLIRKRIFKWLVKHPQFYRTFTVWNDQTTYCIYLTKEGSKQLRTRFNVHDNTTFHVFEEDTFYNSLIHLIVKGVFQEKDTES